MRAEGDPASWLRPLSIGMWAVAGMAMIVEVYLNHQSFLQTSCLLSWLAAFALCGLSFWVTSREGIRIRWPLGFAALLALQAVCVVFMIAWYRSLLGAVLLVFGAWQAAQVFSMRFSLLWVGLQTAGLGLVMVPKPPHLLWLMVTLVSGGLQLMAALVAQMVRAETESRLALARVNEELREVQGLLAQGGRAAERLRVARELHDGMGHRLTALSLALEAAGHQAPTEAVGSLARARGLARDLLRELREVVGRMREEAPLDVEAALRDLVADIHSPRVHWTVGGDLEPIDPARAHALMRCLQELVTNCVKHAQAGNVWIDLSGSHAGWRLRVHDDGRGAKELREGHGLRGMRERVGLLGGRLDLGHGESGFDATVWLPAGEVRP